MSLCDENLVTFGSPIPRLSPDSTWNIRRSRFKITMNALNKAKKADLCIRTPSHGVGKK